MESLQLLQKFTFPLGLLIFVHITPIITTPRRTLHSIQSRPRFRSTDDPYGFDVQSILANLDPRIIGGEKATYYQAPYQLSVWRKVQQVCGAALVISPSSDMQVAITAAHCVCKRGNNTLNDVNEYIVRGGNNNKWAGDRRDVRKFARHEGYDGTFFHDIAIIFFEGAFDLYGNFQPISLPDPYVDYDAIKSVTVSGWGYLEETGETVLDLQIVDIPVVSNKVCADLYVKWYAEKKVIEETSMCAGVDDGSKDSCKGDSGGPAVARDPKTGKQFLAAVVSWGKGCARPGTPGVYMRVGPYMDWIAKKCFEDEEADRQKRERETAWYHYDW